MDRCEFCNEVFTYSKDPPKILNCLHIYCQKCLYELSQLGSGKRIRCPSCNNVTVISNQKDGFMELKSFFLSTPLEQAEKGEFLNSLLCGECEVEKPSWRCVQCDIDCSLLCNNCANNHKELKAFRKHDLIALDDMFEDNKEPNLQMALDSNSNFPCSKHPSYIIEVYCKSCDAIACINCAIFDHKVLEASLFDIIC